MEIHTICILECRRSHPRKIHDSGNKNQREFPPWPTATTASDYSQEETRTSVARCDLSARKSTPHSVRKTVVILQTSCPDFAPSDYHWFRLIKQHLEGRQRQINEKVVNAVREWLRMRGSHFNRDIRLNSRQIMTNAPMFWGIKVANNAPSVE